MNEARNPEGRFRLTINAIEGPADQIAALPDYREKFPGGVCAALADIQLKRLRESRTGPVDPGVSGTRVGAETDAEGIGLMIGAGVAGGVRSST